MPGRGPGRDLPDEANRYDGAPAPSKPAPAPPSQDEAEAEHRRHLASEGCHLCGESDPDKLVTEHAVAHKCSAHQSPYGLGGKDPTRVVCEDGHANRIARWWHKQVTRAREQGKPLAVYTCRVTRWAERPDDEPVRQRHGYEPPRPKVPVTCACGARLKTVVLPTDGGGN